MNISRVRSGTPRCIVRSNHSQEPSTEGNASGMSGFAARTADLGFGVALSTSGTLSPGFYLELFASSLAALGVFLVITNSPISFSEGQFFGTPVALAVIDFEDNAIRFGFDNFLRGAGTYCSYWAWTCGQGSLTARDWHLSKAVEAATVASSCRPPTNRTW
jgi:hypothetical protein